MDVIGTPFIKPLCSVLTCKYRLHPLFSYLVPWFFFFFVVVVVVVLGLHLQHMEVPRLGVELELLLPVHTTATATRDLS